MRSDGDPDNQSNKFALNERFLIGLLGVVFIVGLFHSVLLNETSLVWLFRVFILSLGILLIYRLWNIYDQTSDEYENGMYETMQADADISTITEYSPKLTEEQFNFTKEIDQFFENTIKIIKTSLAAHSAIVFLWNNVTKSLQVEFCASSSSTLKNGTEVEENGTLPGSVFVNKSVVLEKNIPSGQALQYYHEPVEIRSFLGVPMTIGGEIKGVLSVDSQVADDFGDSDVDLLTAYEKLISHGIELIGEREKVRLLNQSIAAQKEFLDSLNDDFSKENAVSAVGHACKKLFDFDRLSVCFVSEENKAEGIVVKVIGQHDGMAEGFGFPLADGINGWVIRRNKPLLLNDLEKGELFRPRYSREDESNYGLRSFLGVPMAFQDEVFGLISLENKQPDFYTEWDQNILMVLAQNVGLALTTVQESSTLKKEI